MTTPTFAVSPEKNEWLRKKMAELGIREEDLAETFVRSSGAGGQHVNKTSTCVQLRHLPTGIEVRCMKDRSQSLNRFLARRELLERLEEERGGKSKKQLAEEKARRQKARRKRKAVVKYRKEEPEQET